MYRPMLPQAHDHFEAWLRTAPTPHALVGWRGQTRCCPLAQYLISQGADRPSVGARRYWAHDLENQSVPGWARRFLETLDAQGDRGTRVTAQEALRILAGMTLSTKETPHAS
jgi:hypothetical protein